MSKKLCTKGRRFGSWAIIEEGPPAKRSSSLCRCDCGTIKIVQNGNLLSGKSRTCYGPLHGRYTKHGHAKAKNASGTYQSWASMIARCENPSGRAFKYYGGRGIKVCERWRSAFASFLEDMGERQEGMELDRYPDNNGNYEPGNCRWATRKQQNRNKRNSRMFTVRGITGCLTELCEMFNISPKTVNSRFRYGWPIEAAFCAGKCHRICGFHSGHIK